MSSLLAIRNVLFAAPLLLSLTPVAPVVLPASGEAETEELAPAANCTYYNNAAHTTVVGQFGFDCCNNRVAWGVKTQFSVCGGCFPCIPPPP